MPAAGVALVPMGLTRSAASRAGFHGRKDAGVDACGADAWCMNEAKERAIGAMSGYLKNVSSDRLQLLRVVGCLPRAEIAEVAVE
jgi:uncharacterized protein (DUF1499 family)